MPRNDQLAAVIAKPPRITRGRINEQDWNNFVTSLTNLDLRSGMTGFNNGTGYFLGFYNGVPVFSIGNSAGSNMRWDGANLYIDKAAIIIDGEELRSLAYGIQTGLAYDGDVVTFAKAYDEVPAVIFGDGGLSYSSTLGAVNQQRIIQALNLTTTGFTMKAKLGDVGAVTPQSDSFPGGFGASSEATKSLAAEAYDDQYTVTGTLRILADIPPATVSIGLYTKSSTGSYELRYTTTEVGAEAGLTTIPLSAIITVDGLDAGAMYAWSILADDQGRGTIRGLTATYNTATITEVTATPSGVSGISWLAIGGV